MAIPNIKNQNWYLKETAAPFVGQRFFYASTVFNKKILRSISAVQAWIFPLGIAVSAWDNVVFPFRLATAIKKWTWCEYVAEYP